MGGSVVVIFISGSVFLNVFKRTKMFLRYHVCPYKQANTGQRGRGEINF
jgi:hypothetical protein